MRRQIALVLCLFVLGAAGCQDEPTPTAIPPPTATIATPANVEAPAVAVTATPVPTATLASLLPTPTATEAALAAPAPISPLATALTTSEPVTQTSVAAPLTSTVPFTTSGAPTVTTTTTGTLSNTAGLTILGIVQSVDEFSSLAAAIREAGLTEALAQPGPYTLFAPTNAAFDVLPTAIRDALLGDATLLAELLRYHIVADNADAARLAELGGAQTVAGLPLTITVTGEGERLVNDAVIVRSDVPATNGVIHIIDRLLTPPGFPLSIPAAPVAAIGLADNPADKSTLAELAAADTSGLTVVEILRSASDLSVAAAAIDSAGLTDALEQAGPFTLFVPTDAAFNQLPPDTLQTLLNDVNALPGVLQYHLVLDRVPSTELARLRTLLTANGQQLQVTVPDNGQILVNGVPIVQADIEASNGVIHVVSALLRPPE